MTEPAKEPEKTSHRLGEEIPSGKIFIVGVVTIVVFTLAIVYSESLRARRDAAMPQGPAPLPRQVGQAELGIVDQTMFEVEHRAADLRELQKQHLDSYGWVDRDAGVIHIPIQQAMQQVLQGQAP